MADPFNNFPKFDCSDFDTMVAALEFHSDVDNLSMAVNHNCCTLDNDLENVDNFRLLMEVEHYCNKGRATSFVTRNMNDFIDTF